MKISNWYEHLPRPNVFMKNIPYNFKYIRNFVRTTIFLILLLNNISISNGTIYETSYACQNKILTIECNKGDLINLVRANYGRFSITICNEHGNVDWSVNCMSPKTLGALNSLCAHKQNCSVAADTKIFGDPCPGTHKYLEAHFQCVPESKIFTMQTTRPTPSWELTKKPILWSVTPKLIIDNTTVNTTVKIEEYSSTEISNNINVTIKSIEDKSSLKNETDSKTDLKSNILDLGNNNTYSTTAKTTTPKTPQSVFKNNITVNTEHSTFNRAPDSKEKFGKYPSLLSNNKHEASMTAKNVTRINEKDVRSCGPTQARNIFWNYTFVGEVNVQPCPGGATGIAKWRCILNSSKQNASVNYPVWYPKTPDLTLCRSLWLNNLELSVNQREQSLISIANDLSQVTNSKVLYGGDMIVTTKIIQTMSQKMQYDVETFPDQRQREAIVNELLSGVVKISSNLLDNSQHLSWLDLSYQDQMRVATSLLTGLEYNAFLLADVMIREKYQIHKAKNIVLSVHVLETKNIPKNIIFPSEKNVQYEDQIELQKSSLIENTEGGLVRLVFAVFDRLESILKPFDDSLKFNSKFSSQKSKNNETTQIVNSKVISASLGKGKHIELSHPIKLTFKHIKIENVSNPICVFWNYIDHAWSTDGCSLKFTNKTHTICSCNHLTNFAILMNLVDTTKNFTIFSVFDSNLSIFIYISVTICIIFIIIAIVTVHRMFKVRANVLGTESTTQQQSQNLQTAENQQLQEISSRLYDRNSSNNPNNIQNSIISNNIINLQMNLDNRPGPANGVTHERFQQVNTPQFILNSPSLHQYHHHHHHPHHAHRNNYNNTQPVLQMVTTQNNIFNLPSNANITVNTTTTRNLRAPVEQCNIDYPHLYGSANLNLNNFLLANERNYFDVERHYDDTGQDSQMQKNPNFDLYLLKDEIFYKK